MKEIRNSSEFIDKLTDAIASGKDTYIFGYTCDDEYDFYFDDEDEETNNFYVSGSYDLVKLQKTLFGCWVGDEDAPVIIALDYYKEDIDEDNYRMIQRLHIFWIED